jgi:acyl-CoA thioester hydrolase
MGGHEGQPAETLAGELTAGGHRLFQRVYYEDTDFSGFVYHARYLHFMERGRTDFLRLLGIEQGAMADGASAAVFVVRHMEITFRAPARMDDVLTVTTVPAEIRGARLKLMQTVERKGDVLIEATVDVAIVDEAGRPRRMPAELREKMARFERT